VLAESSTEFCELRIYYKVVESSWGTIPLKKKASIPIGTVRSVAPISTKIKQGEVVRKSVSEGALLMM
jgi:hypothetical protein